MSNMDYQIKTPGADTVVILSKQRKYKLLSAQLKQCSTTLEELLVAPGATLSDEGAKHGVRYVLCLQNHHEYIDEEIDPVWRRIPIDSEGRPLKPISQIVENDEDSRIRPELFSDYHKLFNGFCNREMKLDDSSVATLLQESTGLVEVAEILDCVPMVASTIEIAFLSKGQELFSAIALSPISWIELAYRIKSKAIFKEALIHLTGRYNALAATPPETEFAEANPTSRSVLDQLSPEIRELLEEKNKQIKAKCSDIEKRVATHYPPQITKHSTTGRADRDPIGRPSYSRDIFMWVAVALYRHWYGQTVNEVKGGRHARDGGYTFYGRLHLGGQHYLTRSMYSNFHEHFPMSGKGKGILEANVNVIKMEVRPIVAPLFKNESQLDLKACPVKWLTCLEVKRKDYLWEMVEEDDDEDEENGKGKKRKAGEAFDEQDGEQQDAGDDDVDAEGEEVDAEGEEIGADGEDLDAEGEEV